MGMELLEGVDRAEEHESFSGESVLRDLAQLEDDQVADARLILIRYLAAQYLTNLLRGDWPTSMLRLQRSAALNAMGSGLQLDRELRSLRRTVQRCAGAWPRDGLGELLLAGAAAAVRGHTWGALALRQLAYGAALQAQLWDEGEAAAAGVAQLAPLTGGERMRRRWQRRARVLGRRAALAAATGET